MENRNILICIMFVKFQVLFFSLANSLKIWIQNFLAPNLGLKSLEFWRLRHSRGFTIE